MKEAAVIFIVFVFLAVIIGFGPLATLWSLNAVFNLGVAYNFYTWLGTLWLGMCIFPTKQYFNKKD